MRFVSPARYLDRSGDRKKLEPGEGVARFPGDHDSAFSKLAKGA